MMITKTATVLNYIADLLTAKQLFTGLGARKTGKDLFHRGLENIQKADRQYKQYGQYFKGGKLHKGKEFNYDEELSKWKARVAEKYPYKKDIALGAAKSLPIYGSAAVGLHKLYDKLNPNYLDPNEYKNINQI